MDGLVVLLYLRDVAAVVDDGDLAAGDAVGELAGVGDVGELVLAAPDDQGAGADPVQPAAQPPVWDRPGELAGAAERPDQAGDGGPLPFGVVREREHGPGGGAVRVVEQQRGQAVCGGGDPVRDRVLIQPQPDRVEHDERRGHVGKVGGEVAG